MAYIFKNQIEDLSGAIPATGDGEQWLKDGIHDVIRRLKVSSPESMDLFTTNVAIDGDGTITLADHDYVNSVTLTSTSKICRKINSSARHAAVDSNSLYYATTEDPVWYIFENKIYVKPAGAATASCIVESSMTINNWDSATSSIDYFAKEHYNLVIMYAALQNLMHRMTVLELDTGFPTTVLSTMTDSDWSELDWDFDGENINYNTWFQALGDFIQNQEDVELATAQMQKIQAFIGADQAQLNKIGVRYQWILGQYNTLKQQYEQAFQPPA